MVRHFLIFLQRRLHGPTHKSTDKQSIVTGWMHQRQEPPRGQQISAGIPIIV
jgi:hypothetical protein